MTITSRRVARQRRRAIVVGLLLVGAVTALVALAPRALGALTPSLLGVVHDRATPADGAGVIGEADGVIATGSEPTAFDESHPGVTNLDPSLLAALREAADAAAAEGVTLLVNSGWRSEAYQQQLWEDAVVEYGSEAEASRWVSPPEASSHVTGDAVDVGPWDAADWLGRHGAVYGLCQTFDNEPWHFELRPDAPFAGCPPPLVDPTHAPPGQP